MFKAWHRAAEQLQLKTVWQSVCDHLITILTGFNGLIPRLEPPEPVSETAPA